MSTAKLDAAGHRWVAELANFNFTIKYRSATANKDADALSRIAKKPSDSNEDMDHIDMSVVNAICSAVVAGEDEPLIESVALRTSDIHVETPSCQTPLIQKTTEDWVQAQKRDSHIATVIDCIKQKRSATKEETKLFPGLSRLLQNREKCCFRQGILYRKRIVDNQTKYQLFLPSEYKLQVLKGLHDDCGHFGVDRTLELVRDRFYWINMYKDVVAKVKNCYRCICRKARPQHAPLVTVETSAPMELVCLDFLSLEDSPGGYSNILVITDHFTRYAQAYATTNQSARTTARLLFDNFILHYGIPERIHSDQGRNFESKIIDELSKVTGMAKSRTTPYHPQGNAVTERMNSTLLSMLGTLSSEKKSNWKVHLPALIHAYNCTKHSSTGYSPFYLMFGRHPRLPIDIIMGVDPNDMALTNYGKDLWSKLDMAYKQAAENSSASKERHKSLYDMKCRANDLKPGDKVLVRKLGLKGKHKLANRWEETVYTIVRKPNDKTPVFEVCGAGKKRTLHRNHLLPIGTIDALEVSSGTNRKTPAVVPPEKLRNTENDETSSESEQEEEDILLVPCKVSKLNPLAPIFIPSPAVAVATNCNKESANSSEVVSVTPTDEPIYDKSHESGKAVGEKVDHTDNEGGTPDVTQATKEDKNNQLLPLQETERSESQDISTLQQSTQDVRRSKRVRKMPQRYDPAEWDLAHYFINATPTVITNELFI